MYTSSDDTIYVKKPGGRCGGTPLRAAPAESQEAHTTTRVDRPGVPEHKGGDDDDAAVEHDDADDAGAVAEHYPPRPTPMTDNSGFPLHRSRSAPPKAQAPRTAPADAAPTARAGDTTPAVAPVDATAPDWGRPPRATPMADNAGGFPLHRSRSAPPVAQAPHATHADAALATDDIDGAPPAGSAVEAQAMAAAPEVRPRRRRNQHNRGPGREAAKAARPRARAQSGGDAAPTPAGETGATDATR